MNRGTKVKWLACIGLLLAIVGGPVQAQKGDGDVFKGKLFPPNIVLEHKDELGLTKVYCGGFFSHPNHMRANR